MLKSLELTGVGPAPEMHVEFAPRINVLTGDNGLGKSFILDVAWWALAQQWAGLPALPRPETKSAEITITWMSGQGHSYFFNYRRQEWAQKGEPETTLAGSKCLAVFARVDGGFSVWDPYREAPQMGQQRNLFEQAEGFNFDGRQVWEGLRINGTNVCEGLERDWVSWQNGRTATFEHLTRALAALAPPGEKLVPGPPMRVFLNEGFDRPTIETATGPVPVALASAGIRRILALAYMLVWTVTEHRIAARLTVQDELKDLLLLFDEPETHLHPKWQRSILPAVLAAVSGLTGVRVQLIAATHSPLVLASLEPTFDSKQDSLIDLHLEGQTLEVSPVSWRRRGDVNAWLTSEIFDLKSARSVEAEEALEEAADILGEEPPDPAKARALDLRLRGLLGESDPFWIRWRYLGEKQGWLE